MTEHKTLKELYQEQGEIPVCSPKGAFLQKIADLTASSPHTALQWVHNKRRPDKIKQLILAKHFKTTPEALFPPEIYDKDGGETTEN